MRFWFRFETIVTSESAGLQNPDVIIVSNETLVASNLIGQIRYEGS